MTRILFVCLGNICRSPLAEAVFNHHIRLRKLENQFQVASCGTANYHVGDPPDPRTVRNAAKNGVTINHLGRQFDVGDFDGFDLIIPMDSSNERNLLALKGASAYRHKVRLLRAYDPVNAGHEVPDPYYGTEKDFQEVFDILHRSMPVLIDALVSNSQDFTNS